METVGYGMEHIHAATSPFVLGMQQKQKKRNDNIDLIKILACIAVVGLHTLRREVSVLNSFLYYLCGFAVPAFMMASGYFLLNRGKVSVSYSLKKICDIVRVVVLWSVIIALMKVVYDGIQGNLTMETWLYFPKTVAGSLVQKGVLWQFWYFGALILMYAALPILTSGGRHLKAIWMTLCVIGIAFQWTSYILGAPVQRKFIQTFRIWTWGQYFILGGLFGAKASRLRDVISGVPRKIRVIILVVITVVIVIFQNFAGRSLINNMFAEYFYDAPLTILWLVALFSWAIQEPLPPKVQRIIHFVSPLTLGIYIIHPLVNRVVSMFLHVNTIWASWLYFIGVLLLSGMASWILMKIRWVKRLVEL